MELVTGGRNLEIALIGEGMLELSGHDGAWTLGYGGDTLNTAIHLARLGRGVGFVSALGADAFSQDMLRAWAAEGVDVGHVLVDPARTAGLYAIRTDDRGERSFAYWRSDSAARAMFSLPGTDAALAAAEGAALLCFSLISVAILPDTARARLADLCAAVRRRGGRVAFDGNYRPRLWRNEAEARSAADRFIGLCDIGLPTLDDEALLHGAPDGEAVAARWHALGAREVVVKLGAGGCLHSIGNEVQLVPPDAPIDPFDTSGAGDAFNAAFLDATLSGRSARDACRAGHRLAGWVIGRAGAIPPRDAAAPYPPEPRQPE